MANLVKTGFLSLSVSKQLFCLLVFLRSMPLPTMVYSRIVLPIKGIVDILIEKVVVTITATTISLNKIGAPFDRDRRGRGAGMG